MHNNVPFTQICHQQLVTISSNEAALKHSAQALTFARRLRMAAATLGSWLRSGTCTQGQACNVTRNSTKKRETPHQVSL